MAMEQQNSVYVKMMVDVLKRKEWILSDLLEKTREQESLLKQEEMNQERFQEILEEKGTLIEELNNIDEGFDALFKKVEKEIVSHRECYQASIEEMQNRIGIVSDLGLRIQALESQNSEHLKVYLALQRKRIREFHVNSKTASSYYQNMANAHRPEQSYYFNEKK
ncbi:MAG: hypothetical protein SOZ48_02285 [Eubacterium sp.]|nr:hypothetical protein [Eubacterium sp.]